jgi:hypothetical protein
MFGSLIGITVDIGKIALAPVQVAAEVTRAVTKPVADEVQKVVKEVTKEVRDVSK